MIFSHITYVLFALTYVFSYCKRIIESATIMKRDHQCSNCKKHCYDQYNIIISFQCSRRIHVRFLYLPNPLNSIALLTVSILSILVKINGNKIAEDFLIRSIKDAFEDISIPLASCACLIFLYSSCTSGIYLNARATE